MKTLLYIPLVKASSILCLLYGVLFVTNTSCKMATCPDAIPVPIQNGAIKLDGVDDYLDLKFAPSMYNLQVGTVSFWVKIQIPDLTKDFVLFSVAETGPSGFNASAWSLSFRGYLSNQQQIQMSGVPGNTSGPTSDPFTSANSIPDNNWHNVTVVSNNNSDNIEMYIDGVLKPMTVGTCCGGNTLDFFFKDAPNIDNAKIGVILRDQLASYGKFTMDDFCIWNRALSLSEVQTMAADPLTRPASGLVVNYTFDKFQDLGQGASGTNDIQDNAGSNHADALNGVQIVEH